MLDAEFHSLRNRLGLVDLQSGSLIDRSLELLAELGCIIGKDRRFIAGAGDGHVTETEAEQIVVDASVGVNQGALGSETLGTVAGYGVAVVEVAVLAGIEFDVPLVVQSCPDSTIWFDGFDHGKVAVGDAELFVGRGELNAIPNREIMDRLPKDADSGQAAGIIGGGFAGFLLDGQQILPGIYRGYGRIGTALDPCGFAATGVANDIAHFVMAGPGTIGAGHVLALNEYAVGMILRGMGS